MHRTLKLVMLVVALCALIPASAFAASRERHFGRAYKAATAANETARADRNWERYIDASDDAL